MNMKLCLIGLFLTMNFLVMPTHGFTLTVNITPDLPQFTIKHGNKIVTVKRNQDTKAIIEPDFAKTSRNCPPFCIQPMEAAPGIKNVEELELIHFMMNEVNQGTGLLVDTRTPDWHAQGVIPGSINIPYTNLTPSLGAKPMEIQQALKRVGATQTNNTWDFTSAKTLAIWCNGPWCGQSHAAIQGLLEMKYPKEKILYYRGGMQIWKLFGLTIVPPMEEK